MMPRETAAGETRLPYNATRAIATARPRPPRRSRRVFFLLHIIFPCSDYYKKSNRLWAQDTCSNKARV
uniref:Uncharacterized protein n=1 Tax=Trichogramma kaykai TaxID=54128 RepID=A0ABD2VZ55_9HYME